MIKLQEIYDRALFEVKTPQTLYHGTLKEYIPVIDKEGLVPYFGKFVSDMYNEELETPELNNKIKDLIFAADKKGLNKSINSILYHMVYGKGYETETFFDHAAIAVIKGDESELFSKRPKNPDDSEFWQDHPIGVEPGDYYSEEAVYVNHFATGKELKKLMKQNGMAITRRSTNILMPEDERKKEMINVIIKANMDDPEWWDETDDPKEAAKLLNKQSMEELTAHYAKALRKLGLEV